MPGRGIRDVCVYKGVLPLKSAQNRKTLFSTCGLSSLQDLRQFMGNYFAYRQLQYTLNLKTISITQLRTCHSASFAKATVLQWHLSE